MQERLEGEEGSPRDNNDLTFDSVSSSARLLPENIEVQINNDMGQIQNEENSGSLRVQYMVALAAVLGGMTMGTTIGWTGPSLVRLNHTNYPEETPASFQITDTEESWIGSLMPIGALLGGLSGGFLIGKLGRKPSMYIATAIFTAGYFLMLWTTNAWYLYFGRLITGLASGITSVSCPTYIAEIASPKVRGLLGSAFQVMVTFGILHVDVIGCFLGWKWITVGCLAVIVLWAILMLFIPETPHYLLTERKYEAARTSLEFLRGHTYIENELAEIQESVEESARTRATARDLAKPQNLKPLLISILLMFGQQFSGMNAIMFYGVNIFEAAHTKLDSFVENIIMAVVQVVATITGALIVDRYGRRCLLISSGIIMALSISSLGAYFYVFNVLGPDEAKKISFLPLPSLCIYVLAFSLGFGAIPWLMMSELMAPEVKSISSSIAAASNWTMAFIVTQFYPTLAKKVGNHYTFWGFAGLLVISLVLIIIFVPETKGKSLEEIQQYFRSGDDEDPMLSHENQRSQEENGRRRK